MKIFETGKNILKFVTTIGNGICTGAIYGLAMITNPVALPLKLCSLAASYIVAGVISEKTDDYIDRKSEELKKEIAEMKQSD